MTVGECIVLSVLISLLGAFMRPTRARCMDGWWLPEGIRLSGDFACHQKPTGHTERTSRGILVDYSWEPPGVLHARIYCTGGRLPIIGADGVSVGCQPGGY